MSGKKQQKKAAPKAKAKVQRVQAVALQRATYRLSPCAEIYLRAITDPFDERVVGACVPDFPSYPSMKVCCYARGVGSTGAATSNPGWIMCSPFQLLKNDGATTTFPILYTALNTYSGTTFLSGDPASTIGLAGANTNAPFTAAQIAASDGTLAYRLVAAGIRVRATGTLLNAGGSVAGLQEPQRGTLSGKSYTNIRAFRGVEEFDFDRDEIMVNFVANNPSDVVYSRSSNYTSNPFMGIMVMAAAAGQPFSWEVIAHFEVIGSASSGATRSPSDINGYVAVSEAVTSADDIGAVHGDSSTLNKLYNRYRGVAVNALSAASGMVIDGVSRAVNRQMNQALVPRIGN